MSFVKANKSVLESLFGDGVNWAQQAAGVNASNGAPSLATDGVDVKGKAAFAVQVVVTSGTADFSLQVWGYANGAWTVIPSGLFETLGTGGMLEIGLNGVASRIYLQFLRSDGTVDLNVGVPNS